MATTYCEVVEKMEQANVHKVYHDTEYGFPIYDDDALFGRLILEINQAGLSWTTILNKKENFHKAYHGFNIDRVAAYKKRDIIRLMNDVGIIRNRLKIAAAIENAKQLKSIRKEFGSFRNWLDHHHPKTKDEWVKIFKLTFMFIRSR
ncbi:MAG TPA: DNA-3-methyladenine glycosylase I [Chitinophagales bacterium]|nr:DNA-3-methyladenine glycosylase I [Chitinophagales bacterium]